MVGSTLSLHWDPVVAMETESKVTGYLVGPGPVPDSDLHSQRRMTVVAICIRLLPLSLSLAQVLLKRHRYNDVATILTNKTAVELTLSANDNYLVQIKAVSEGGEGAGSEPIHIHKLSEFTVVLCINVMAPFFFNAADEL